MIEEPNQVRSPRFETRRWEAQRISPRPSHIKKLRVFRGIEGLQKRFTSPRMQMAASAWTPHPISTTAPSLGRRFSHDLNLDRLIVSQHAAIFFDQTLHRRRIFLTHQDDGTSDAWKDFLLCIGLLLPFKPSSCSLPLSPLNAFAFFSFHVSWLHPWCFLDRAFQTIMSAAPPPAVAPFQSLFASVQLVLFQINQVLPAAEVHPHQTGRGFLNDSTHAEALLPPRVRTGVIERPEGTLFPGKPDSLRGALCGREERPEVVPGNCLRRSGRAN